LANKYALVRFFVRFRFFRFRFSNHFDALFLLECQLYRLHFVAGRVGRISFLVYTRREETNKAQRGRKAGSNSGVMRATTRKKLRLHLFVSPDSCSLGGPASISPFGASLSGPETSVSFGSFHEPRSSTKTFDKFPVDAPFSLSLIEEA